MHRSLAPSDWVLRWARLAPSTGTALDLACGHGRHALWLADIGFDVTAVDIAPDALASLQHPRIVTRLADLENQPWPLTGHTFDLVVVTNYLWRPTLDLLLATVKPGGWLVYETFAVGNETVGKPSRPDFLLQPNELLTRCTGWHVVAYENGFLTSPDRFVQRIVAQRPAPSPENLPPPRHLLDRTR